MQDSARVAGPADVSRAVGRPGRRQHAADVLAVLDAAGKPGRDRGAGRAGLVYFTTQAHENHLFFALPLLSLAWPTRPWLLAPFGVITLTLMLNMVLHDQLVLEALGRGLDDPLVEQLRLFNAALNVGCLAGWSIWAAARRPAAADVSASGGPEETSHAAAH